MAQKRKKAAAKIWLLGITLAALAVWLCGCRAVEVQEEKTPGRRSIVRREDGRIQLTLDTVYRGDDAELRRIVSAYNRQSKDYYVQLVDVGRGQEDLDAAQERVLIDMMLGNGSDIVDLTLGDVRMLGSAGVLADLYGFRVKEEWQEKFLPNVVEIQESGGCLYSMGTQFNLFTVVANGALVDPEGGWNMQEMTDAFAKNGKGAEAFVGVTGDGSLYTKAAATFEMSCFALDDYIDWERREADFETDEFYRFLEFCKEKEQAAPRDLAFSSGAANGEYLAGFALINSVADYQILKELYGGHPAVKGFPTGKGRGISIQIFDEMGIYAGSPCQEGAWDFLQYYLDNYEDPLTFPTEQRKLEENLAAAMEKEIIYCEDSGEWEEVSKGYYRDEDDTFVVYAASEEDTDALRQIIAGADRKRHSDLTVQLIICEEMESCIKGDIPVEEVASHINNRVNLYLKEQERVDLEVVQGYEEPTEDAGAAGQQGKKQGKKGDAAGAKGKKGDASRAQSWDGGRVVIDSVEDFFMGEQAYFPHVTAEYLYALPWEIDRSTASGELGGKYQYYYLYRCSLKTGEESREPLLQSASAGIDGMDVLADGRLLYLVCDADRDGQYLVEGDAQGNLRDEVLENRINSCKDAEGKFSNIWSNIRIYPGADADYVLYQGCVPAPVDEDGIESMIETSEIRELADGRLTEKHLLVKNSSGYRKKYLGLIKRADGFYTVLHRVADGIVCLEKRDPDDWRTVQVVSELEVPAYANCVFASDEYGNLYVSDEENLYRYREDTATFVPILAWQDASIYGRNIREIAVGEEGLFVVLWESDNRAMLYNVTKIN